MNKIVFENEGFPFHIETIEFLQQTLRDTLQYLTALGHKENYILSGCNDNGTSISAGAIVIYGEVLPFKGGTKQSYILVRETAQQATYKDGVARDTYFTRYAEFGTGPGQIAWNSLIRVGSIADKVDSEPGKGLSTNDFTDAYKQKVDNTASLAATNQQDIDKLELAVQNNQEAIEDNADAIGEQATELEALLNRILKLEKNTSWLNLNALISLTVFSARAKQKGSTVFVSAEFRFNSDLTSTTEFFEIPAAIPIPDVDASGYQCALLSTMYESTSGNGYTIQCVLQANRRIRIKGYYLIQRNRTYILSFSYPVQL